MAKYAASGRVGPVGIVMTLAFALLAGGAAGIAFHFIGRLIYLVLVFPLVWGLAIGMAVAAGVRMGKCRNGAFGVGAGLLAAVVSFGLFQVLENMHVRSTVLKAASKGQAEPLGSDVYDEFLQQKHGGTGFRAQLSARADMGMNISRRGRGGDGKPLISGAGMYVYWFVELGIIALVCGATSVSAAHQAFCEKCEEWYGDTEVGGIVAGRVDEAQRALISKDFEKLPPLIVRTNPGGVLKVEKCPKCTESPVVVRLQSVTVDDKGKEQRSTVFEDMIPAADAQAMERAIGGPVTPAGGAT